MIRIGVSIEDLATPDLRRFIDALTGPELEQLNEVGGRAASNAAARFHREFDAAGGWRGSRSSGSGGSAFGAAVAAGWHYLTSDGMGAEIANNAEHYGFKVRGGTITPKRWTHLTIPLVPEAKGRYVAEYQQNTGNRLFRPKGRAVLMERTGPGKGEVRSVYALLKSVTQPPWPEAVPQTEELSGAFTVGWLDGLDDLLESR